MGAGGVAAMQGEREQCQERGGGKGCFGERMIRARSHMVVMVILVGYNPSRRAKLPRYFIEMRKSTGLEWVRRSGG